MKGVVQEVSGASDIAERAGKHAVLTPIRRLQRHYPAA
jgi:hypothetical protein